MHSSLNPTLCCVFFFFNDTATTEIYTLSLHDALPISRSAAVGLERRIGSECRVGEDDADEREGAELGVDEHRVRSEEHTSELQSQSNLVCRLLLEKKKKHHCTSDHDQNWRLVY